jgi:tetratricopeptide (TPR) repeat protein
MTNHSLSQSEAIDTLPEFYGRCLGILKSWKASQMPFTNAAAHLNELKAEAIADNNLANQGYVENLLGVMQGYRGKFDISIQHFQTARVLFEQAGDRDRVMNCDLNIGESFRRKGDANRARGIFRVLFQLAKEANNVRIQALCLTNEAQLLLDGKHLEEARAMFQEAFALANSAPEIRQSMLGMLCEIHRSCVTIYLHESQPLLALEEAKNALQVAKESGEVMSLGQAHLAMGEVLMTFAKAPAELGELSANPDDYFNAAAKYFRDMKAEAELARTLATHAQSLAKRKQRSSAVQKFQKAILIFTRLGMTEEAAKAAAAQLRILTKPPDW